MSESTPSPDIAALRDQHLRFGWWSLLVFLTLGIALEAMHGFKVAFYLDVDNETRRLMWTLAHAHGVLLSLVHVAFGLCVAHLGRLSEGGRQLASRCLTGASVLMPAGFFLGGTVIHGGDPGLGIALVPFGGLLLFVGVLVTARGSGPPR